MTQRTLELVKATGEEPLFAVGDRVRVSVRYPVGHYRVPRYVRGREAFVEAVIRSPGLNNEEEAFGRNAGARRHYYRVGISLSDVWPEYAGGDALRIEIFESWLERIGGGTSPEDVNHV